VQRVRPVVNALIDEACLLNSGDGFFVVCGIFSVYVHVGVLECQAEDALLFLHSLFPLASDSCES
jgi:hypothetical protein